MHHNLHRSLAGVASDLWGTPAPKSPTKDSAPTAAFPPFEQLWSRVDDTVDWTEVLAHPTPTDGLTTPETWNLYRRYADKVLLGDAESYLAVLKATDPLQDLTPWAEKFDVACTNAELLKVTFTAVPDLVDSEGWRYLSGMALRIARDLFALLPITQVDVTVLCNGNQKLHVTFERSELQKVRFGFIDPVDFALQCGAVFTE